MNWKLIFTLSLIGLGMAFATVFVIPNKIEPLFWLLIFILYAVLIVKNVPGKYFLHGFMVSFVNGFWIAGIHVLFFATYMSNNPDMWKIEQNMPMPEHPRVMMLITGPLFGAGFGLLNGLFAFITSKIIKKK